MLCSHVPNLGQYEHIIEKFWIRFSVKKSIRQMKVMSEVITTAYAEIGDHK